MTLKKAVSAGIGLFIALIGLFNAQVIVANPATKISLFSFKASLTSGTFHTVGITVVLSLLGVLFTAILMERKVRGNILWGILFTWILGIICELTGLYVPDPAQHMFSVIPDFSAGLAAFTPASMEPIFGKIAFEQMLSLDFFVVMFAFLFVALMADAVATTAGAVLGTSTVTTFVESATGVSEGGRTGLTAMFVAFFFLVSLFLSPLFLAIPAFATAPALIIVGFLMLGAITGIEFDDLTESIPAYLTIIAMPFCYSVSEGICFGVISYVLVNLLTGNHKKISVLMYILAVLFIGKYIFI